MLFLFLFRPTVKPLGGYFFHEDGREALSHLTYLLSLLKPYRYDVLVCVHAEGYEGGRDTSEGGDIYPSLDR